MRTTRIITGLFVWLGIGAALWLSMRAKVLSQSTTGDELVPALWKFAAHQRPTFAFHVTTDRGEPDWIWTGLGDPVLLFHDDGTYRQVGRVVAIEGQRKEPGRVADWCGGGRVMFFPGALPAPPDATTHALTFYETSEAAGWMVEMLLPPEKRKLVAAEIAGAYQEHSAEILAALKPVVADTLRDVAAAVEAELPAVIARHKKEIEALGGKYQSEIVQKKLLPLVKEEIWPVAKEKAVPLANDIGKQVWARVSVGTFAGKFLLDRLPFTDGDALEKEWGRFLEKEALPIIESHTGDMIKVVQETLAAAAKNPKVQAVFRESVDQTLNDPALQRLVWTMFREAVVDNEKLRLAIDKRWNSPQAKAALQLAGDKLEPTVVKIGDMLFGTREAGGITPELARVLRFRLLKKDARWYVLERATSAGAPMPQPPLQPERDGLPILRVRYGGTAPVHPFVSETKKPKP